MSDQRTSSRFAARAWPLAASAIMLSACGKPPPTAVIGADRTVPIAQFVQMFDYQSIPSSPASAISFMGGQWSFLQKPPGSIADWNQGPTADTIAFAPDVPGAYVISLIVMDDNGAQSTPAKMTITAVTCAPTVTYAGPVATGYGVIPLKVKVTENCDASQTAFTYLWTALPHRWHGSGSPATIQLTPSNADGSSTAASPNVDIEQGAYSAFVRLQVTDGSGRHSESEFDLALSGGTGGG